MYYKSNAWLWSFSINNRIVSPGESFTKDSASLQFWLFSSSVSFRDPLLTGHFNKNTPYISLFVWLPHQPITSQQRDAWIHAASHQQLQRPFSSHRDFNWCQFEYFRNWSYPAGILHRVVRNTKNIQQAVLLGFVNGKTTPCWREEKFRGEKKTSRAERNTVKQIFTLYVRGEQNTNMLSLKVQQQESTWGSSPSDKSRRLQQPRNRREKKCHLQDIFIFTWSGWRASESWLADG